MRLFKDKFAVSDLIGVIMLLAIMIACVAVFYTFFAEPGTEDIDKVPLVSMSQTADYVSIVSVKNAQVHESDIIVKCLDSSSVLVNCTVNVQDTILAAGDTITFTDLSGYSAGDKIDVKMSNSKAIIGTFEFTVP